MNGVPARELEGCKLFVVVEFAEAWEPNCCFNFVKFAFLLIKMLEMIKMLHMLVSSSYLLTTRSTKCTWLNLRRVFSKLCYASEIYSLKHDDVIEKTFLKLVMGLFKFTGLYFQSINQSSARFQSSLTFFIFRCYFLIHNKNIEFCQSIFFFCDFASSG